MTHDAVPDPKQPTKNPNSNPIPNPNHNRKDLCNGGPLRWWADPVKVNNCEPAVGQAGQS